MFAKSRSRVTRIRSSDRLVFATVSSFAHRKALVSNPMRIKASALEDLGSFGREVLIDLEFHAVSSPGRSMEPSRTNSAAYARAASMSWGLIAG
jgi:hypothetical protein